MVRMNNDELIQVIGGFNITGAIMASIVKGLNTFLDLGRSLGTSFRRVSSNKLCPIS
jgi:hypothetical protein